MSVVTTRPRIFSAVLGVFTAVGLAVGSATTLAAQGVTTSSISGWVSDANGVPLSGAQVVAVHTASGSQYAATSRADGRFTLPGMRVGGPYRVTASYVGYQRRVQDNVYLTLGVASDVHFNLAQLTVEVEAITVTADRDATFSSDRTGAATSVPSEVVATLPTVNRRVEDMLRLTPQYSSASFGFSFAGQDNRFNNMTIDGSYFNNSFGLAGQPGDRTRVSPVSLDALEQIEVNVAPFDVRQGSFVGAGINMVTRSGTNDYRGSLYFQQRSDNYVGTRAGAATVNPGTFTYSNVGLQLGGPIIRNRLFFFASYERDAETRPGTNFRANLGGETPSGNVTRVLASDLDALSTYMRTNFNYTTGSYQGYEFETPATRFIARLDYNVSDRSKISLRYNFLNSSADILESTSSSLGFGGRNGNLNALNFSNSNYAILENIRSIVGEWNTSFGTNMSNSFIVGYNSSDESRKNISPPWFPLVEILNNSLAYTSFGFEPFTPANQLRYHSYQFQNNFTIYGRNHSLTLGASVERYHSDNVFFPGAQSVYVYDSLAAFYADANDYLANPNRTVGPAGIRPRLFQVRYNNIPGQIEPRQPLDVTYAGVYVQDEYRPNRNLTLTLGLRVDAPKFGDTGFGNAVADTMNFRNADGSTVRFSSGKLPDVHMLLSPRFGFNYNVGGTRRTQVRGGTGLFAGRPAYVWISNQIGNTGVLTGFISASGAAAANYPFHPDPDHYKPTAVTGAPATSFQLALTDPDFKFPQVWRSNFAVDQRLPWGLVGTAEYIYTRDVNGVAYLNANLPAPALTFSGADNRPRWGCGGSLPACPTGQTGNRLYSAVSDATTLTNQGIGRSWNMAFSVERPFRNGLFAKVAYSYGRSENTVDAGSIASGSWTGNRIQTDPNNPTLGFSQFNPGNRVFAALSYSRDFFGFGNTTLAVYWDGHNAGNGAFSYSGDMNGDGAFGNDLIYIPRNASDTTEIRFEQYTVTVSGAPVTFTVAQQQAAFEAFILQDDYLSTHRGQRMVRNGILMPWVYRADVSLSQDVGRVIGGRRHRLQIRLDIFNFMNLISKNSGIGVSFVSTSPLIYRSTTANGFPVFRLQNIGSSLISKTFQPTASATFDVYRFQLGARYYFNW